MMPHDSKQKIVWKNRNIDWFAIEIEKKIQLFYSGSVDLWIISFEEQKKKK